MGNNRKERRAKQQTSGTSSKSSAIDIPEDEQWRIINQSGILKHISSEDKKKDAPEDDSDEDYEISPLADEIFRALYLVIPMSFMLLLMEILVHYQYGRKPDYDTLRDRLVSGVPIIAFFVFYSNRYKTDRRVQIALFWLSCICGTRLVWLLNRGNWLTVMKQCPPIATAWIYAVVQLDLGPAVLSLMVAAGFTWYKGYQITF
ncbi:hypothetical protein FKP32DRAFT_1650961 [Trametes sanguinea]|uniref:Uncharacterized protein n=1 Tax=Trametes sanguinea TaxID=158606 RepID=A0ACC1QBC8_9APHY|nr:hypothetical protein FKP32DRAFT_1650961 [Trametes sanguinea]KAJ3018531.1 hypothetical protein NUW54_g315 [Trametes sanguinea]